MSPSGKDPSTMYNLQYTIDTFQDVISDTKRQKKERLDILHSTSYSRLWFRHGIQRVLKLGGR